MICFGGSKTEQETLFTSYKVSKDKVQFCLAVVKYLGHLTSK